MLPVLDLVCEWSYAFDGAAERIFGVNVLDEDVVEQCPVLHVERNAVLGDGVLDGEVVDWIGGGGHDNGGQG